ncbi:hypothetical protein SPRG_10731 [Saprolegnia parasitica CBS 223.65]|uniref:Uncharacterized protein n=1 Tax=Saprolegnia parasitica (strain CBS 223.65) TaxID=695850 RepID=A0A067BYD0_SAPPC|nr:hypothetical protein SPRG_10731 [Saprolegnia parasitica CBS 223.65]KDO23539.1 hypothetical protein SPRG_10731 [Saprolegnia parasitica CBS 223.65]|eukprot:XP_012205689.1 hypothetical protein SPRG_10731 [Saprolegnia parasitica CBS 223.65]
MSLDDLSALQRENLAYERALHEAVSSLKERRPTLTRSGRDRSRARSSRIHEEDDDDLVQQLTAEIRRLRHELTQRGQGTSLEARTMGELAANLESTTAEIERKTRALTTAMDTIEDLEGRLAEHTRVVLAKETEIGRLHLEATSLREEKSSLAEANAVLLARKEQDAKLSKRLERHVRDLSSKLQVALAQISVYEQARDTFSDMEAASRTEKAVVYDQLQETKTMLARLQKDMGDRIGRRDARISQLKTSLFDATQEAETLRDRVQQYQAQVETLARTEASRLRQWTSERETLEQRVALANDAIDRERDKSVLFQREMQKLQHQLLQLDDARKTDAKRHEATYDDGDEASSYVWSKYVEAIATKR